MEKKCAVIIGILVAALLVLSTRIERPSYHAGVVIARVVEEAHNVVGPDPWIVGTLEATPTPKCWSYDIGYKLVLDEGTKRINVYTTKDRYDAITVGDRYQMRSGDLLNNWPTPCKRDGTK